MWSPKQCARCIRANLRLDDLLRRAVEEHVLGMPAPELIKQRAIRGEEHNSGHVAVAFRVVFLILGFLFIVNVYHDEVASSLATKNIIGLAVATVSVQETFCVYRSLC